MDRPPLEVADLVRAAGDSFIERSRKWISWKHVNCFSTRSVPLSLPSERTYFSSSSTTLLTILLRIRSTSGLIPSRAALYSTASAQLDAAPSHD